MIFTVTDKPKRVPIRLVPKNILDNKNKEAIMAVARMVTTKVLLIPITIGNVLLQAILSPLRSPMSPKGPNIK